MNSKRLAENDEVDPLIKQFKDALIRHDWHYNRADGQSYYKGLESERGLHGLMSALHQKGKGEEAKQMYHDMSKRMREEISTTNLQEKNNTMKKSQLKQLIREILSEDDSDYELDDPKHPTWAERNAEKADQARSDAKYDGLDESKKGLSGMEQAEDKKKKNTQMKVAAKTLNPTGKKITSTTSPKEKKEGTKLPVKDTKKNTEKDHKVKLTATSKVPASEKKEKKALPVGGNKPKKSLKEEILIMIRESIGEAQFSEMARTKGALGKNNPNRTTPIKNTGLNYKSANAVAGDDDTQGATGEPETTEATYKFTFVDPSGNHLDLDPDLPYYGQNQLTQYLEKEVMAFTGNLEAKLSPNVVKMLNMIKNTPEKVPAGLTHFILKYNPVAKEVQISGSKV